uniref:FAM86 N-terminal domain-containing protein n=1 Tax=Plectus sambesii TaxID=2011161 RepID=A0A914WF31_9BILA
MENALFDLINLHNFSRLYHARVPVNCLEIDSIISELKDPNTQIALCNSTISSSADVKYPPRNDYRKRVLKAITEKLEATQTEICTELYEAVCASMAATDENANPTDISHRLFLFDGANPLVIGENVHQLSEGTTGLSAWQAAFTMAEWAAQNAKMFAGKNVLELGCGVGVTGLAVLRCCRPMSYTFTDGNDKVLDRLRANVSLNSADFEPGRLFIEKLDWSDFDPYRLPTKPDIVLGSDLCFEPSLFPALVSVLNYFIRRKKAECFIATTIRNEDTQGQFLHELGQLGLTISEEWKEESTSLGERMFPFIPSVQCECVIQQIRAV